MHNAQPYFGHLNDIFSHAIVFCIEIHPLHLGSVTVAYRTNSLNVALYQIALNVPFLQFSILTLKWKIILTPDSVILFLKISFFYTCCFWCIIKNIFLQPTSVYFEFSFFTLCLHHTSYWFMFLRKGFITLQGCFSIFKSQIRSQHITLLRQKQRKPTSVTKTDDAELLLFAFLVWKNGKHNLFCKKEQNIQEDQDFTESLIYTKVAWKY